MPYHLTGLIAAPPTPMAADGGVDLDTIERQAELLAHNGLKGAFVCGTTGEGLSMSVEERMRVAERWRSVSGGRLVVIAHVGHTSIVDARALAAHAAEIGADAIAVLPPIYHKPRTIDALVDWCERVASAAPSLPMFYYHIPVLTGVHLVMCDFLPAAAERVATLAGVKFTDEDLMDFGRCVSLMDGRFSMLFGRDEILLSALALGARGAVGTTYNFAAPLYLRIMRAFEAGDLPAARAGQARAMAMVAVFRQFGGLSAAKAIMKLIGLDCGPVRPPLKPFDEAALPKLRRRLEEIGFFDDCCRMP